MPRYFCDYCNTYLTSVLPSVRKKHCAGKKHKDKVKVYYEKWVKEHNQQLNDEATAAYEASKAAISLWQTYNGVAIPPPPNLEVGHTAQGPMGPPYTYAPTGMWPYAHIGPYEPMRPMMNMWPPMMEPMAWSMGPPGPIPPSPPSFINPPTMKN